MWGLHKKLQSLMEEEGRIWSICLKLFNVLGPKSDVNTKRNDFQEEEKLLMVGLIK